MMFTSSCFCKCYFYQEVSFSVINNIDTPSFDVQINFDALKIDTENSATGVLTFIRRGFLNKSANYNVGKRSSIFVELPRPLLQSKLEFIGMT